MLAFQEIWPLNYIVSVVISVLVIIANYGANSRFMVPYQMLEELKRYQVIPDVMNEGPKQYLKVEYMNGKTLEFGNMMDPHDLKIRPVLINWKFNEDHVHALIFVDLDKKLEGLGPHEYVHWLVVNIRGVEVLKGLVVIPYTRPRPARDSGIHRFAYLVYKQYNGTQAFDIPPIRDEPDNLSLKRGNFSVLDFARRNHLGSPIAANFFQAIWTPPPTYEPDTAMRQQQFDY